MCTESELQARKSDIEQKIKSFFPDVMTAFAVTALGSKPENFITFKWRNNLQFPSMGSTRRGGSRKPNKKRKNEHCMLQSPVWICRSRNRDTTRKRDIHSTISQKCIFGLGKQANSATKFEQEDGSQCLGATTQIQIAKSTLVFGVNCLQNLQIAFERFQQLEGGLSSQVENLNVFEVAPWSVKKVKNPLHRNSTGI